MLLSLLPRKENSGGKVETKIGLDDLLFYGEMIGETISRRGRFTMQAKKMNRRRFLLTTGMLGTGFTLIQAEQVRGTKANRRIKIGLVGCGNRGRWITRLFLKHGGYEVVAVADYFRDRADRAGAQFQIPESHRFDGLNGYKRLLETEVEAVVIESPPYFHAEQAWQSVLAGKHVYMAKPIGVDVPSCQLVEAAGKRARREGRVFLVDFQTRASPDYQEVIRRVRAGQIGRIVCGEASYQCGPTWAHFRTFLQGKETDPEARLRAWGIDRVLSGDVIVEQNIHALDVATWFLDAAPIKAYGTGGLARGFGSCWDHWSVIFYFPNDVIVTFNSKQFGHGYDDICCRMYGTEGTADTHYFGKVVLEGKNDVYRGGNPSLYQKGAEWNIASFYKAVVQGDASNPTVEPSVRSNLTCILGRTAAYQGEEVSWREMIARAEKWEFDTSGLKA